MGEDLYPLPFFYFMRKRRLEIKLMVNTQFNLQSILKRTIQEEIKVNTPWSQIANEADQEISQAQMILNLCKNITNHIDIEMVQGKYNTYFRSRKKDQKYTNAQLMIYGAQLVYALRQFFTEENLYFNFASNFSDSGGKQTSQKIAIDDEVIGKFRAFPKQHMVGLGLAAQRQLQGLNFSDYISNRTNRWREVEQLADFEQAKSPEQFQINEHSVYRSIKNDKNILATYSGKGRKLSLYYNNGKNNYKQFNKGWLYQWYNDALGTWEDEAINQLNIQISSGTLQMLINSYEQDRIPGTKQGDSQIQGRQIQSKFMNQNIISYNNIKRIIYELEISLTNFITQTGVAKSQASETLLQVLETHFIPNTVIESNEWASKKAKEIIQKLEETIPRK